MKEKPKIKLAINGGAPVRTTLFPAPLPGASLIGKEELNELEDVIRSRSPFRFSGIGNSTKVAQFESEAKALLGVKYVLAVSSGSAALFTAIASLGIGIGDEVILPAFGWYADYSCIVHTGALPVFADIDDTLNIDPEDIEKKITTATKAIIVIHYQGAGAQMDKITRISKKYNIKLIEDCSQSFGGKHRDKFLGTIGDIGISSFQGNKIITCGEGGILYTNDEELFVRAIRYHDLGYVRPYFVNFLMNKDLADQKESFAGCQFRMSELQGAFLIAQLRKLDYILERTRLYHKLIRETFKNDPRIAFRMTEEGDCGITIFMKFKSKPDASFFAEALVAEGIPVGGTSALCNILESELVKSKKLFKQSNPPFGTKYDGKNIIYDAKKNCLKTNKIIEKYVPIAIGPLYSHNDIKDITTAISKILDAIADCKEVEF